MSRKTILVVDDSNNDRKLIRLLLRKYDCVVVEAANGAEASKQVEEHKPSLILIDHMMPDTTGYDWINKFRGNMEPKWFAQNKAVPIIMLTARKFDQGFKEFMKFQGVDFLPKPVQQKTLLGLIESLVGQLPPKTKAKPAWGGRKPVFGKRKAEIPS